VVDSDEGGDGGDCDDCDDCDDGGDDDIGLGLWVCEVGKRELFRCRRAAVSRNNMIVIYTTRLFHMAQETKPFRHNANGRW
jgi:hypothetical protein